MRIGLISTVAIPTPPPASSPYGGIEKVVHLLQNELDRMGHDICLFAAEGSRKTFRGELFTGMNEHELAMKAMDTNLEIYDDHSHSKAFSKLVRGKNMISSCLWTDELGENPVFPSRAVARAFNIPKAAIVPYGIEVDAYPFRKEKGDFFLFFSRIAPYKGTDLFIKFVRAAGVKGVIAGHDGSFADRDYAGSMRRMATENGIQYLGERNEDEKKELLANARALVLPYRWLESFGIVVVEALACGTPCIVSSHGGPAEIVEDGISGYVCDIAYPHRFVDAMKKVDKIEPVACRDRSLQYSSKLMAENYLEIYEMAQKARW